MKSVFLNSSVVNLGNTFFIEGPLASMATFPDTLFLGDFSNYLLSEIANVQEKKTNLTVCLTNEKALFYFFFLPSYP